VLLSTTVRPLPLASAPTEASEHCCPATRVELIVQRHLNAIWRTARDLGVATRDLEDVVQDVLVVVVRRLDDIEAGSERAFVLATTARVASNWRRRHRRKPADLSDAMDDLPPETLGAPSAPLAPDRAAEQQQELKRLAVALEAMTEPQRVVFTLFELEQQSGREIALQLGLSEAVVFARVRRARAVFRRLCALSLDAAATAGSK
jgi:RNA polymerase sigma-70 factor (ECF subfamily)